MASLELIEQLAKQLETINEYKDTELISRRDDWGPITFDIAAQDIETARSIAADLSSMPLVHLTDGAAQNIMAHVPRISSNLRKIDEFKIEGDARQHRDTIVNNLKAAVLELHTASSRWIPYLAYKRGDVSENIRQLQDALAAANAQLDEAEAYTEAKQAEIDRIALSAREASGRAGVGTFNREFHKEADRLAAISRKWLKCVVGLACVTIGAAIGSFFLPALPDDPSDWEALRHVVTKVSVVAMLFTGTIWCGRIYRALAHQCSVNKHRALSLTTFQAFVEATPDAGTRDAVLLAATKSIFGNVPTGFVDERGAIQDTSVSVLDIGKSAGKAVPTRQATPPPAE